MEERFDAYYEWLGIPPKDHPPHAYRLLGLDLYESNPKVIDAAAEQRMLLLRTRQSGQHAADSQRLLNEISQAQRLLHDAVRKKAYDDELRSRLEVPALEPLPMALALPLEEISLPVAASPLIVASKPSPVRRPQGPPLLLLAVGGGAAALLLIVVAFIALNAGGKGQVAQTTTPSSNAPPKPAVTPKPTATTSGMTSRPPANVNPKPEPEGTKFKTPDPIVEPPSTSDPSQPVVPALPIENFDWYRELRKIDLAKPDAWEQIAAVYTQAAPKNLPRKERCVLFRRLLDFAERMIENDQLLLAARLLRDTEEPLAKANYPLQAERAQELRVRGSELYKQFKLASEAIEQIKKQPNDAEASLAAGSYYCFAKGEWKRGLPLLRKGNDAKLKKLAVDDMAMPAKPMLQARLADAWWDYADSLEEPLQSIVRLRAGQWYREALEEAKSLKGTEVERIEQRVNELLPQGLVRLDAPSAETAFEQGSSVYLDDLDEEFSAQAEGNLGRHGETGYGSKFPVLWKGGTLKHSLFLHPPANARSFVTYRLGGAFRELRGTVGIAESPNDFEPASPVLFRVRGDDRILWESKPQQRKGFGEEFAIDVSHVDALLLEVECRGSHDYCHAVWIDPQLRGALYRNPTFQDRYLRGNEVYLDDLLEADSSLGWGRYMGLGSVGHRLHEGPILLEDHGHRLYHSLVMVPVADAKADSTYYLAGRYKTFTARVGITGSVSADLTITPLTYAVMGDGRELWKSPVFSMPNQFEECSIRVDGVDQLRLEVRCPGPSHHAWAVWIDPRLTRDESADSEPPAAVRADRVVIWNTHNGDGRDRGTKRCNLLLYRGTQLAWQRTGVRLPWDRAELTGFSVPVPGVEFDRLRVELTDMTGPNGAGLAEVEVFSGKENIARRAVATSTLSWPNGPDGHSFSAPNINDGVATTPEVLGVGSLILADATHGWVELQWRPADTKKIATLKYPLQRHPETAIAFRGHWYAFYVGGITAEDAQRHCEKMGGYLPIVESAEENEFLNKLSGRRQIWLGMQKSGGRFVWINGKELDYTNWKPGEPNNNDANETYGDMFPDGLWNDAPSSSPLNRGFICEWEF